MKVAVITGSRDWSDRESIERALAGADALIVGDCPRGADRIAWDIALEWDIIVITLHAYWSLHGNAAGPERNGRIADMAASFRADELGEIDCHAFPLPGSRGTWDCKNKLEARGFEVKVH